MAGFYYTLTLADRFSQTFDQWNAGIQTAVRNTESASARMEASVGKAAAAMGVAIALSVPAMAASFIPLDQALARLETNTTTSFGSMDAAMARSLASARQWSSEHVQSTTQMIQAQNEFATAGMANEEALLGIAAAAELATASGDDLVETSRFLASLFNTFGEAGKGQEAPTEFFEKTNDALAETIRRFQVQMPALRDGFSYVTAQAVQMGQTGSKAIADFGTALGILNTAGLRGGVGGAALQNVFMKMDESVVKLGLDTEKFVDEFGEITSITDYIDELASKLEAGRSAFDQLNTANEVFGIRGAKAALILVQQRELLREQARAADLATGASKRMQEIMERTTGSQLQIAANNAKNFAQAIGESLVPAFISLMKVVADVFNGLTKWAGGNGVAAAAVIFLTGTLVAAYGGFLVLNGILAVTGAATISLTAAVTALGIALLKVTLVGAVIFAALSLLAKLFSGPAEIEGGLSDTLGESNFRPITESMRELVTAAREAEEGVAGLRAEVTAFKTVGLDIIINQEEVTKGLAAARTIGQEMRERIVGSLTAMGVDAIIAEQMAEGARKGIAALRSQDIKLSTSLDAAGEALRLITTAPLGAVGDGFTRLMGSMEEESKKFLSWFNATFGTTMTNAAEALASLQQRILQAGKDQNRPMMSSGAVRPEDLAEGTKRAFGEAGEKAVRSFLDSVKLFMESMGDTQIIDAIRAASPAVIADIEKMFAELGMKGMPAFRAAFEEASGGGLEEISTDFWEKFGNALVNNQANDTTGAEIGLRAWELLKKGIGAAISSGAAMTGPLTEAIGSAKEIEGLEKNLTRLQGQLGQLQEEMKKGFTADQVSAAERFNSQIAKITDRIMVLQAQALPALRAALAFMPDAFKGTDVEKVINSLIDKMSGLGAQTIATGDAAEAASAHFASLGALMGSQQLTPQAQEAGGKAMAAALDDALLLGSVEQFRETLFVKTFEGMKEGIVQGAMEGLLLASGLGRFFETDKIAEQVKTAITAASSGGIIDPAKLRANLGDVGRALMEGFKGQDLSGVFSALSDFTRGLTQEFANATGAGDQFFKMVSSEAEKATAGLQKQVEGIAELKVALLTATQEQRFYLQDLLAIKERTGIVRGVDLGSADLRTQIELVSTIYKDVVDRFGQSSELARGFAEVLKSAFATLEKGNVLEKNFGLDGAADKLDRLEKAATGFAKALSTPTGANDEMSSLADQLERGRTAAEAIRDAVAQVRSGNVLPGEVRVGGSAGGTGAITVNMGGVQIIMDVGAAITQEDIQRLSERLTKEFEQKRDAILLEVRARGSGR